MKTIKCKICKEEREVENENIIIFICENAMIKDRK